jgi:Zn-dependent peptidase ImmA (M78 family)
VAESRPVQEGRQRAEAIRYEHGLGHAPIRDLFGFIERTHPDALVIRYPMPAGPDGALLRARGRWLIVVNSHDRMLARQRFTAAHELAHFLFDRDIDPVHLDRDLFDSSAPSETRANAFAVHLILPATVILQRRADATLDLRDPEALVGLAMEYGLSTQSFTWHLKNVLELTEAERRRIAQLLAEPFRLARRVGLAERVRQEHRAENRPGWPRHYLALVWQAFDRGDLDKAKLHEFLEDPDLADEIIAATSEPKQ